MQQQVLFVIVILLFTVRNITITYRNLQRYCTTFRIGVVYGGTLQSYVNCVDDQEESTATLGNTHYISVRSAPCNLD